MTCSYQEFEEKKKVEARHEKVTKESEKKAEPCEPRKLAITLYEKMRMKLEDRPLLEGRERREIKDNAKMNSVPATTMDNYRWIWTDMALQKLPYLNQLNAVESLIIHIARVLMIILARRSMKLCCVVA